MDTSKLYAEVASEAWQAMNAAYQEFRDANALARESSDYDDCETYLYVFADGTWSIDHAQYIQTTNGCISSVPIGHYNGPAELAEDIEANEDWDAIEEGESEDDE